MSLENFPNFFLNFSEGVLNDEAKHFYQFKSFRLDVAERQLLKNEEAVSLTPKAFDVLALLVERSGHLVEKDELLRTVWADSFVEEINVARIVHTLRKTLGENENGNKFIETVAKKGYRFVAEVTEVFEPISAKPENGNGHSAIKVENVSESDSKIQQSEIDAPPRAEPKRAMRVILFGVGFLSAVFLLVSLSFNFQSSFSENPNKIKSIAVLPVKPINAGVRDELYEIGIAESIIHRLSGTKSFYVRPLSATRQYTDLAQDPLAAGHEQKTDYVLSSNYQMAEGKIRITAQLFNVATGQIEETYKSEKDAGSIFAAQDAIAAELGNVLFARFAAEPNQMTAKRGTTNEEAYRLYLQGKNLTAKRNGADAKKAIEYFEQAIRLDPNYALAYAGMAHAYSATGTLKGGFRIQREVYEKAQAALNKAIELDVGLADIYAIRGQLKIFYDWDFPGAEKDLRRAIELEPNNDLAHWGYAFLLNHSGRFDEAFAELKIALEIDPNSLAYQRDRGRFHYFARRYDEAIAQLERVLEIDENFNTAFHMLILAYEMKGDYDGAFKWIIKEQKQINPESVEIFQKAYQTGGGKEVRRKLLESLKLDEQTANNYYRIAREHALLNEKEQAFEYLNKALENRQSGLIMLKVEPAFDSLRDDPRFNELVRRVGF